MEQLQQRYPFEVVHLPYPIDGLEPYISTKSLEIHYNRLYAGYVENLNKLLSEHPELQDLTLEQLISQACRLPQSVAIPLSRYAGGVYNHILYFYGMMPQSQTKPLQGQLKRDIDHFFGSFDHFRRNFSQAAQAVFGSGYTWLVHDKKELEIINMANQENPLLIGLFPVMCIDVWEHAYYLTNYNKRAEYIGDWWNLVNWNFIGSRYAHYASHNGTRR